MITLLRHAESIGNVDGKIAEWNCGLTEIGIDQSNKLSGEYDLILMSPMKRCRETLGLSGIFCKNVEITTLCREIRTGFITELLEGEEIMIETKENLQDRLTKFLLLLKERSEKYNKILVISHCGFIRTMTGITLENAQTLNIVLDNSDVKIFL